MNVEENRLATFSTWPADAAIDSARLAKAGFYYCGERQDTKCFECEVIISDWNYADQAMTRHRQANPECPFVINPESTTNVPMIPSQTNSTELNSTSALSTDHPESHVGTSNNNNNNQHMYRHIRIRLLSFLNWPKTSAVSPLRLAYAGFYYRGNNDMVECAFCKGVLGKWKPGDDPDHEHRIHFPNCQFYLECNQEDDDDEENEEDDNERELFSKFLESNNVKLRNCTASQLKELGIQTHTTPAAPAYATYECRLGSFKEWPKELNQTPEMLATAGFYYMGGDDYVRCFHCDGGLINWETTDDVWVEHAKWFPKCAYVTMVQGKQFIKQCIDKRPVLESAIGGKDKESADKTNIPSTSYAKPSTSHGGEITNSELENMLITAPATAALQIGLNVGIVKQALKKRMQDTGIPYSNVDELIEDVLRVQLHDELQDEQSSRSEMENNSIDNLSQELTFLSSELAPILNEINNEQKQCNLRVSKSKDSISNSTKNRQILNDVIRNGVTDDESTTNEDESTSEKKRDNRLEDSSINSAMLLEENRRLKEARLCKICMDREIAIVFLPCGHLVTCIYCVPSLTHCPVCREDIRATVRTFLA